MFNGGLGQFAIIPAARQSTHSACDFLLAFYSERRSLCNRCRATNRYRNPNNKKQQHTLQEQRRREYRISRKLLRFEIIKMRIAVLKIVLLCYLL